MKLRLKHIACTLLLLAGSIISQPSAQGQIDSLMADVDQLPDTQMVLRLISITRHFVMTGEESRAQDWGNQMLSEAQVLGDSGIIGQAYFYQGLAFASDPPTQIEYYRNALDIFEKLDHPWLVFTYTNLARTQLDIGLIPEAIATYQKCYEMGKSIGDSVITGKALSSIGYAHDRSGDFRKSIEYQRQAIEYLRPVDSLEWGFTIGRMAIAYDDLGIYDSAVVLNEKAITMFRELNEDYELGISLSNLANTYIKTDKPEEALELLVEAADIKTRSEAWDDLGIIYINLGKAYTDLGDYRRAHLALEKADSLVNVFNQLKFKSELYERYHELAAAEGNDKLALEYFKTFKQLSDSLVNEAKAQQINELEVKFDTERKRQENELLRQDNEIISLASQNRLRGIIGLSVGLLLILIISVLLISRQKQRKRQELAQKETEYQKQLVREREKGLRAVFEATENERQRIARDLHDGIGQQLSGIKHGLSKHLNDLPEDQRDNFEQLSAIVDQTATEVRSLSHQMMPRAIRDLGLVPAISDLLEKSLGLTDIEYGFEHFNVEDKRFDQKLEIGLFRICQELINNIIKHSHARFVSVQLFENRNTLILIVEDNGDGFDYDAVDGGIGLTNIESRINTFNGEVNWEPSPESGTVATIKVPLT